MRLDLCPIRGTVGLLLVAAGLALPLGAQAPEQQPTFRAGVDLIEMDVSVLDRNRRPVRGLTAGDFTVIEDGQPQRVVAVSSVDLTGQDQARSARMRYVARDVSVNDLSDQLGDGRLVAIVFDDVNLPSDDPDIVRSARETARYIVDRLGPSDMAAVVYAYNAGRTQDFTGDRSKLLDAIDRFQPARLDRRSQPGLGGVGSLQQWSPAFARSSCMRGEPAVPTLDTVASRLATSPGRRKAVMFISVGVALSMSARDACGRELADAMKDVYRKAQRGNVNIYGIDPAGFGGYQEYVRRRALQRNAEEVIPGRRRVLRSPRMLQEFLEVAAENTGGRAIINTDAIEPAIAQIMEEDRSYYILGYESTNRATDGRFRRVEIRVNRPGASVRSRSGYWARNAGSVVDRRLEGAPSALDSTLSGLTRVQGVPLRVLLTPMARAASGGTRAASVAAVLTVRYPPLQAGATDTLTITRNVYDTGGRTGPPLRTVETVRLEPNGGEEVHHDLVYDLTLEPGPREVRFYVQSALLNANGTVYGEVDVPDFSRSALALSGLAVTGETGDVQPRPESIRELLPIVPTSSREFTVNDVLTGFLRIHQAGPAAPVTVTTEIFDASDQPRYQTTQTFLPEAFAEGGGVPYRFDMPLAQFVPGPHLLSVTARLPGGRTARRDLVFRVR